MSFSGKMDKDGAICEVTRENVMVSGPGFKPCRFGQLICTTGVSSVWAVSNILFIWIGLPAKL